SGTELGLGATLIQDSQIIEAFVGAGELLEATLGFLVSISQLTGELVGDTETEKAHGDLVLGIDSKDVAAYRFGFFRLVQITIVLDLGHGFRHAVFGDLLELAFHVALSILTAVGSSESYVANCSTSFHPGAGAPGKRRFCGCWGGFRR